MKLDTIFFATRFDDVSWPSADTFEDVSGVPPASLSAETVRAARDLGVDPEALAHAFAQAQERVREMAYCAPGDAFARRRAVAGVGLVIGSHGYPWGASLDSASGNVVMLPGILKDAASRGDWSGIRGMLARALRPLASSTDTAYDLINAADDSQGGVRAPIRKPLRV